MPSVIIRTGIGGGCGPESVEHYQFQGLEPQPLGAFGVLAAVVMVLRWLITGSL